MQVLTCTLFGPYGRIDDKTALKDSDTLMCRHADTMVHCGCRFAAMLSERLRLPVDGRQTAL
jgi:hypothetical protein